MGRTLVACIEEQFPNYPDKDPKIGGYGLWKFRRYIDFTDRHNGVYDDLDARAETPVARTFDLDLYTRERIAPDVDWNALDDDTGICVVSAEAYMAALGAWLTCDAKDLCRSKELLAIGADVMGSLARPAPGDVQVQVRVIFWYDDTPFVGIAQWKKDHDRARRRVPTTLRLPVEADDGDLLGSMIALNPGLPGAIGEKGISGMAGAAGLLKGITSQLAARFPEIPKTPATPAPAPPKVLRPVVFLDFDGVVVPMPERTAGAVADGMSAACVGRLNAIVAEMGADVVISSEWRYGYTAEDLAAHLRRFGFEGTVLGMTDESSEPRGELIMRWMDQNGGRTERFFVVLDDSLAGLRGHVTMGRIVEVDPAIGLSEANVVEAVRRWQSWRVARDLVALAGP